MVRARHFQLHAHLPVLTLSDSSILGIIVVLFFKCMAALFDPAHRRGERTKWGLVSYTVLMFLVATVLVGMGIYTQSNSYIDNREFPGIGDVVAPGPLGYQSLTFSDTSMIIANSIFYLNGWLADGLLVKFSFIPVFNQLSC